MEPNHDRSVSAQNFLVQLGGVPGVSRDPMPRIVQDAWIGISLPPMHLLQPFQQTLTGMQQRPSPGGRRSAVPDTPSRTRVFWGTRGGTLCQPPIYRLGDAGLDVFGAPSRPCSAVATLPRRRGWTSTWVPEAADAFELALGDSRSPDWAGCVCQLGCTDGCRTKPISRSGLYRVFDMRPEPYLGI